MKCPECNATMLSSDNFLFCQECGKTLPKHETAEPEVQNEELLPTQEAERVENPDEPIHSFSTDIELESELSSEQLKTITTLSCGISGYSQITVKFDPEEVDIIMKASLEPLTEVVKQNGGVVLKYTGNGLIAAFGIQQTLEDDPIRAALAALNMRSTLLSLNKKLEAEQNVSLKMRIGLNTGFTKVSQIQGNTELVGNAVKLASQLESKASMDTILISYETYKHIRGLFEMKPLEPIQLKGKVDPIEAYELLSRKEGGLRIGTRGIAGLETQMIGREAEMDALTHEFMQSVIANKKTTLVTVVGEAGLGKSRLEYEFGKYLKTLPIIVKYGKGSSFPVNPMTLYPFYRIICEHAGIKDDEPKASAQKKLENLLLEVNTGTAATPLDAHIEEQCHFIAELIGLEYDESSHLKSIRGVDPQQVQMRGFKAFCQLFEKMAQKDPLVLVFEDIHWADHSTLLLIEQLFTSVKDVPLLLLCLTRPELYEQRAEFLKQGEQRIHIDILPLKDKNRLALINHLLQHCTNIPEAFSKLIDQRSEGNPFFAEELIRMFIDQNVISRPTHGSWTIHAEKLKDFVTPSTIEGVIQARFESLNQAQQQILRQAAVVGRIFLRELLVYIAEKNTTSEKALNETLNELNRKELVYKRFNPILYGYDEYTFKHILTREVIYRNTLFLEKQRYHKLAGEWLGQQPEFVVSRFFDTIAHHFEQGLVWDKACHYYQQAGANAHKDNDLERGIQNYTRALEMILQLRNIATEDQDNHELEIRLALNKLFDLAGKRDSQAENLYAALTLSEQGDDQTKQVDILNNLSRMLYHTNQNEKILEYAKNGLTLARTLGYRKGEAESLRSIGIIYLNTGDFAHALSYFEQALPIQQEIGDLGGEASILSNIGVYYLGINDYANGLVCIEKSQSIHHEIGYRRGEGANLNNIGFACIRTGDYAGALASHEQSLDIRREIGDHLGETTSLCNIGLTYSAIGDYEQALTWYEQALNLRLEIGDRHGEVFSLIELGKVYIFQQENDKAIESLSRARALMADMKDESLLFTSYSWLGMAYLESSPMQAVACSKRAVELLAEMKGLQNEPPQQIWWNHYWIMSAVGGEAKPALQQAYRLVMEIVSKMTDNTMRQRYLEEVRVNREIVEAINKE